MIEDKKKYTELGVNGNCVETLHYLQKFDAIRGITLGNAETTDESNVLNFRVKIDTSFDIRFTNNIIFDDNRFTVEGKEYVILSRKSEDGNIQCIVKSSKGSDVVGFNLGISTDDIRKKLLILLSKNKVFYVPYNLQQFFNGVNKAYKIARAKAQI